MAGNSFLDKAKTIAQQYGGKAKEAAVQNSDKIEGAVDKAADFVDKRTKGKYAKHVDKAQTAAKKSLTKLEAEAQRDKKRGVVSDPPVADPDPGLEDEANRPRPTAADPHPPVADNEPGKPGGEPGPPSM